ncbi:MAG: MotA/TolQ/ExbB proton channel family protein [Gammaproteobacteria bacterium]
MNLLESFRSFLNAGGDILWIILLVSVALWCLISERLIFFRTEYPEFKRRCLQEWNGRADKCSARALHIRESIVSRAKLEMGKTVPVIKMLVALCPLLGLLGTVTGMIQVFDVLSVTGTGNPRSMASGISRATIPTMAGMVIAIAGLYFSKLIDDKVDHEIHQLADLLKYH